MITADPQRRVSTLARILDHVGRTAPDADRDLLLALAPVVYGDMPDPLALRLSPEMISARLAGIFRFVARTMPPAVQLYKGLPGLHVTVRNPDDAEARAEGSTHEVTIVETHSPDAPFVFESLKNYFKKEGLRVFSSIHPIFSVRRQWERVVWIGGPQEDGSRELYCQFRIERVEARDRLRRIEHQVFSVLKAVFLGVEDFPAMRRGIAELAPRLRDRRGGSKEADAARSFLDWLMADNYVILGVERYTFGPDGLPHADSTTALGVFKDPTLLPVVFPGLMEVQRTHLRPAASDERVIDVDYCPNAQAIHHLEPIDDVVIREWGADGTLAGIDAAARPPRQGRPHRQAAGRPADAREAGLAARAVRRRRRTRTPTARRARSSTTCRGASCSTPTPPSLEDARRSHGLHVERRRDRGHDADQGQGYEAVSVAFSDAALLAPRRGGPGSGARRGVRPDLVQHLGRPGRHRPARLLLRCSRARAPDRRARRSRAIVERVIRPGRTASASPSSRPTGRPRAGGSSRATSAARRAAACTASRPGPRTCPRICGGSRPSRAQLETHVRADTADSATLKIYSARPLGLTATLRTLEHLALPVQEELSIPLIAARRPHHRPRAPEDRRRADDHRARWSTARTACASALRALQEDRATDDPLNGLILNEGLDWREVEVLRTLRNHLLQIRPVLNAETVNGVLRAQLRRRRPPSSRLRRALRSGLPGPARGAPSSTPTTALRGAMRAVASLFDDEILRGAREPGARRRCAPTPTSGRSGRWWRSRWTARKVDGHARRRGRCSRSTCTRASSRASTCAAARWRAAASAGAIATTTSAPRSSA